MYRHWRLKTKKGGGGGGSVSSVAIVYIPVDSTNSVLNEGIL